MDDQPPGSARPGDAQGQPRDDRPGLGRWLAQQPREDSVPFTFEWRETQETLTEETRSEGQTKDDDTSVDCLHHVAGCQVTDEKNWSLANRIPLCHHENTKGDCGQTSSNAHDTSQSEDVFTHQQQEHLRHVLFPSSGQEILELPFNQASMPSNSPETIHYSGISYGAIQQNHDADQWLETPDATCIHKMTDDRRRAFFQLYGEVQQELSTIDNASGSQQPFAPENSEFNNLYPSHDYSMDDTFTTHTTESCFSHPDTNQFGGYTLPRHPVLVPSHSSKNPSLRKQLGYGSPTIPSYSSDTHSRAMDDVSSEMTFSTAPTTNKSLHRNHFGSYNLEPAQFLLSNMANFTKLASDNLETQSHGSGGPAYHAAKRIRPSQYSTSGRKSKKRRVCKTDEDGHDLDAYNCPFYLQNPSDYGEGNWELCAKRRWKTYQRMREHLLRKHILPAILCEKCFEEFEDGDSLREHCESQCERKAHSPYLSTEQQSQLQTRIKGGMKEAEKMEQMYQIFSINGAFPSPERSRQIRVEMLLRSAIAASLISPGDIERITNDTLQAIQRARSTVGIELEYNPPGCDGFENALAVSSDITEHAPADIEHNGDSRFLHLGN
ncbi:hypothetical protein M431DRAFT_490890 [Trichoderma harzianum CBS 226.95]|uniref:C2H2-type domain-containing protein n=1 Tax=Trichoderma harzianum CBS 226.95 TaxID=983964 RepID=A0A2T4AQF0_TRIHA|nr:hypothetical protein M431DRAFT_490890 [Trichoderma harzianum CBS 226.95]PTB59287.1 hypothetical protein M431DRAFT_490890 [Trichoderma harzianum CBS 226.95]